MSLHSSLKIDTAGSQQRSVLTRIERIKDLMKKGRWSDEHAVTALPKLKVLRIKARKAIKTKEEGALAEGAAAAAPAGGAESKAAGKAPAAKPSAGKAPAKAPAKAEKK